MLGREDGQGVCRAVSEEMGNVRVSELSTCVPRKVLSPTLFINVADHDISSIRGSETRVRSYKPCMASILSRCADGDLGCRRHWTHRVFNQLMLASVIRERG